MPILQIRRVGHRKFISQVCVARKGWGPGLEPGLGASTLVCLSSSALQERAEASRAQQSEACGTGRPSEEKTSWVCARGWARAQGTRKPRKEEGGGKDPSLPEITFLPLVRSRSELQLPGWGTRPGRGAGLCARRAQAAWGKPGDVN